MKRIIMVTVAVAIVLTGCGKGKKTEEAQQTIQDVYAEKGIPVSTVIATESLLRHIERTGGTTEGIQQTILANPVGGILQRVSVKVGQKIRNGAVVATMTFDDGSPIDLAQSNYDYAERSYTRVKELALEGATTQEQIEGARVQYESAKRSLNQARMTVRVTAPFAGTVLEIYEDNGTNIAERTPLVNMADLSKMKIDAWVNEQVINNYKVGQKAFIVVEQDTLWGTITRTALGGLAMTHGFRVTFEFDNTDALLKVGMYKEIFVVLEEKQNALSVPIDVVIYRNGKPHIFVVEDGVAFFRPIELGIRSGESAEVLSGLGLGDSYVVVGGSQLSDGVKVNVIQQ